MDSAIGKEAHIETLVNTQDSRTQRAL